MTTNSNLSQGAGGTPYAGEFSLSITQALKTQLTNALDKLNPAPLTRDNLNIIDNRGGVYQLLLDQKSVYIGKSKDSLQKRVSKHYRKLSGRTPGLLERISFRCVYVNEDLDSLAPEKMLIQAFKKQDKAQWNQNGFGNNDPGVKRDGSMVKAKHFDRLYGINLDLNIKPITKKPITTLYQAMASIRLALPYTFRFPAKGEEPRGLKEIDVSSEQPETLTMTVKEWMDWIADHLPTGWMITSLPGYIICYRESNPDKYESRTAVWLSFGGSFNHLPHTPAFDEVGVIEDADNANDDEE